MGPCVPQPALAVLPLGPVLWEGCFSSACSDCPQLLRSEIQTPPAFASSSLFCVLVMQDPAFTQRGTHTQQHPDTHRPHRFTHPLTPPGTHSLSVPSGSPGSFLEGKLRGLLADLHRDPTAASSLLQGGPGSWAPPLVLGEGAPAGKGAGPASAGESQRPTRLGSAGQRPDLSAGRAEAGGALGGRPACLGLCSGLGPAPGESGLVLRGSQGLRWEIVGGGGSLQTLVTLS